MTRAVNILALSLLLAGCGSHKNPTSFRASFLKDDASLDAVIRQLDEAQCPPQSLDTFRRCARNYYSTKFKFDLSAFPRANDGTYGFKSAGEFISALPHRFWDTDHPFTINCYDTVILLTDHAMSTEMKIDQPAFIVLPPTGPAGRQWKTNATPRDALTAVYPVWYTNALREASGFVYSNDQACKLASLYAFRLLPDGVDENNVKDMVLTAVRTQWAAQGFRLPGNIDIVLMHNVDLTHRYFVTSHAGVLLKNPTGYTHIEKCGGCGPFLSLDFEKLQDLLVHYGGIMSSILPTENYTHFIMTIGDKSSHEIPLQPVPILTKDNKLITESPRQPAEPVQSDRTPSDSR